MRFPEFEDAWNNIKLKDILKIRSGRDQKNISISNGKYNIYGSGGIIGKTNSYIYDKESVGIGRKGTIDKPFYFNEPFWTVDTLFYSEMKCCHPKFIFYLFQTINWYLFNQSTGVPSLTASVIENISKAVPNILEQEKISYFLSLIDNRIETQKKIIEEIHLLKKAICDTYKKLNCTKFKIKDLGNIGRGRVISSDEISKQKTLKYPVYSSQTMNNGIMGYLDDYDFEGEYITWTTDGANAGTVFYHNERFNCTNVCGTIKITNEIIDPFYMSLILQYESKKYVSLNLANPKLMNNTMASIEIKVPPLTYQLEITKIVKSINKKLDNEVKILKLYQKQKDYLLEHMFI